MSAFDMNDNTPAETFRRPKGRRSIKGYVLLPIILVVAILFMFVGMMVRESFPENPFRAAQASNAPPPSSIANSSLNLN